MGQGKANLYSLADIEGKVSPHQLQVKGALKMRASALELVTDVAELAEYIGGIVENPPANSEWMVSKEIYPGVIIYLVFTGGDSEFPPSLRALYGGNKIKTIKGDELATVTISLANQLLRYVRENSQGKEIPEICHKV